MKAPQWRKPPNLEDIMRIVREVDFDSIEQATSTDNDPKTMDNIYAQRWCYSVSRNRDMCCASLMCHECTLGYNGGAGTDLEGLIKTLCGTYEDSK